MSVNVNKFSTITTVLGSAVADTGTFTVAYPSGTSQLSFNTGLANSAGHYAILDKNVKWTAAASDMSVSFGSSDITVTNSSGETWAAGTEVILHFDRVDANDVMTLAFPINLASITTAMDVVTDFRPGVDGVIEDICFVTNAPVTTASKLATLNLEIGTTNVTGGTVALTSAACTPMGKVVQGADITANNTLTRESKISLEASSVTAFAEGSGTVFVRIRKTKSDTI